MTSGSNDGSHSWRGGKISHFILNWVEQRVDVPAEICLRYPMVYFCALIVRNKLNQVNTLRAISSHKSSSHARSPGTRNEACCWRRGNSNALQNHLTGAPNDCFLWNICAEKQKLPRMFYSLWKAKNTVPFMYKFRNFSNKYPTIFFSSIFPISLSRLSCFRGGRKINIKSSESKVRCRDESEKFSLS